MSAMGLLLRIVKYLTGSYRKKPTCSICDKPVTSDHPKADVYHLSCLKGKLDHED